MFAYISQLIDDLNLKVSDSVEIAERSERRGSAPSVISAGPAAPVLNQMGSGDSLWQHQSEALRQLSTGENVVISTGTASGKSLIFQIFAVHRLLTEPESKVLAFYPLRALTSDQHASWLRVARWAGLSESEIVKIDGSVALKSRRGLLERGRVVLMTPDVCHAWLMRTAASASSSAFLRALRILILDEAHVYESVFGSNVSFLFRRILAAKHRLSPRNGKTRRLQVIAATATIKDPADHLERLTGLDYRVIDEKQDGAPRHQRKILHVEGPGLGQEGEQTVLKILDGICSQKVQRRFIAFVDSRQGVERIAAQLGYTSVKPYRSGYEAEDRRAIEDSLRKGILKGVISTSALELGIDISDMEIGVNLGVPHSRKSFRQRLGRIGRTCPGAFIVVAEPNAFRQFGENLSDYYASSVEPSHLYLGNRFIHFTHARCIRDELEPLGQSTTGVPSGAKWPDGFASVLRFAREGWPTEYDFLAQIDDDAPHLNYPLRQLGEANIKIRQGRGGFAREIGDIALNQAIREAYPGAHYLHLGTMYRVRGWRHGFNEVILRVDPTKSSALTRPLLRRVVTVDLSHDGIVEGRIRQGETGLIAEALIQVNESVEGYSIGSTQYRYRDLRIENPNMTRKQRAFRTTGIVIQIEDHWFSQVPSVRAEVAEGLRDLLCRDWSIAPQDVDAAHTNISIRSVSGAERITNAIVIYDGVYGGLRLTEKLFDKFNGYVEQLRRAVCLTGDNAIMRSETTDDLGRWADTLKEGGSPPLKIDVATPKGWLQVYKPGSVVGVYLNGTLVDRELLAPEYKDFFGTGSPQLYYVIQDRHNYTGKSYQPHNSVQGIGDNWEWCFWNPESGEYMDVEDA